jgi:hypothetical protein
MTLYLIQIPCHLVIMDPTDNLWASYFTKSELDEIKDYKKVDFKAYLPDSLNSSLKQFEKKKSIDGIFDTADKQKANPSTTTALFWLKQTIINANNLFVKNAELVLPPKMSERDLLQNIWSFINSAFLNTDVTVYCEVESDASAYEVNKDRNWIY